MVRMQLFIDMPVHSYIPVVHNLWTHVSDVMLAGTILTLQSLFKNCWTFECEKYIDNMGHTLLYFCPAKSQLMTLSGGSPVNTNFFDENHW